MQIIRWRNVAAKGEAFHAARNVIVRGRPAVCHGHDFAEIFWIDSGRPNHLVNGASFPLQPGSLLLMRPTDCHGIEPRLGDEVKLTNIAFPREVVESLQQRHFANRPWLFSPAGKFPSARQVDPARMRRFNHWADELSASSREGLYLERFLLNILVDLVSEQSDAAPEAAPTWLAQACVAIRRPENFSRGVEYFLRLCGRSREHVARTVRRHFGQTPTEYVNGIRMTYAQRQLEMGDQGILEIALDCGIQNLSHFYRLFRERTGTTPRSYRLAHGRPLA